ncbi:MAG: hypothetical protein RIB67_02505 [Miltoncostaeaceae bacterium]
MLAAVAAAALALPVGAAQAVDIVYLNGPEADKVADAGHGALRQVPAHVDLNPRWPAHKRIGKIAVRRDGLMNASPGGMLAVLRSRLNDGTAGRRVALDEINPNQWTASQAASLVRAMRALTPDERSRVVMYAASPMLQQVGRVDPRRAIPARHARLLIAMSLAGRSYFQTYGGRWAPLPADLLARDLPRVLRRWPSRAPTPGLLVGPSQGIGQDALWTRLRTTPAGRTMLAAGVVIAGGDAMTQDEVRAWLAEYREYRARPGASPTGRDRVPPVGGGLAVASSSSLRPGARYWVGANRPGRAVVRLITLTGWRKGTARVIAKTPFTGPQVKSDRIPRDLYTGRYRIVVIFTGKGGLRDRTRKVVRVVEPPARRR